MERIEVGTTPEDRALIDRAAAAAQLDLTDFVLTNLWTAARRLLTDRHGFELDADAVAGWEAVNRRPAGDLPGVRALLARPSPFEE